MTLTDAALNHRGLFKQEDLDAYDKAVTEHVTRNLVAKNDREAVFRSGQEIKKLNRQYARQREQLTEALENEIKTTLLGMTPESQMLFKANGNALQLLIEEFFKTDNVTNLIAVAKAYNNGAFKHMFEKTPEQKIAELQKELASVKEWLSSPPEGADEEDVKKATEHSEKIGNELQALLDEKTTEAK